MAMLILNGKKAGLPLIRQTINLLREQGHSIEVRCTWEGGDVARYVKEAVALNITRIIAGGGDGTVNEVADALAHLTKPTASDHPNKVELEMELAILPLGTANDFATACLISLQIETALTFAVSGNAHLIDLALANERYFINVASAGFGAQITVETPVELKDLLGGQAYFVSGLIQALNFTPYQGKIAATLADGQRVQLQGAGLLGAICNGRLAGGGQNLAPNALLNDGLLDVFLVKHFPSSALKQVVDELKDPFANGEYVNRMQVSEITLTSDTPLPVNLDGEPTSHLTHHIRVLPGAIKLICPDDSPVLMR
ncbi:lipid kinase YegS [Shewanella eurypsychrophilus]|uniref:Lipid kinase YegS n=1 Tax=Shewanella eurypsychrophilus TaxID=2593656 RepID=A0ABX6V9K1_9GAMM|nr:MULTISPECIES: lipid kinase YegS [Shewanella]QFU23281.1 lipid kinase YegS [Shewanella sp. YLB-09]QPG58510.1 lipid kinase YegS [Shewanella eurypsychrophilus]